jgi:hypothetical protein
MVKYVAHVEPCISTGEDYFAEQRLRWDLRDKFYEFMKDNLI